MVALVDKLRTSIQETLCGMEFVRNVVMLAGGTALSQSLLVLASPFLTRLYTPEDFGVFGVYISIFSVLTVVASLCYQQAIPLPQADDDAASLLVLSLAMALVTSLLAGLGIALWSEQIVRWANAPGLEPFLRLLPLSVLGAGAFQALNYWMARKQRFGVLSYTKSLRTLGQVGTQGALGLFRLDAIGLVIGHVASQFLGMLALWKRSSLPRHALDWRRWAALAKTYKRFPLFTVWTSLINVIGLYAPSVLFARYFTLDTAGFFSQTIRVLGLPAGLIGQAVAQVFYPEAARHEGQASMTRNLIEQVATSLLVMSFMVFSIVALHGSDLFAWAFGQGWGIAGRYAQYLAPWFMISLVSSPLSSFALVKGRQRDNLIYGCFLTVSRLGAIWVGNWYDSADLSVLFFSAVNLLFYLAYVAWILHLAGSSLIGWLGSIKEFVLLSIPLLAGLFVLKPLLPPLISVLVSGVSVGSFSLWFWLRGRRSLARE
jgi:O-antigen/teichoic acid export membrane protein